MVFSAIFLQWATQLSHASVNVCVMIKTMYSKKEDVIQLTLTVKMTTAQVVETSVTVNNNSPIQDYVHPELLSK